MKHISIAWLFVLFFLSDLQGQGLSGLKDIATFPVGTAPEVPADLNQWQPDGVLYDSILRSQFNSVTANWSMKWGAIHANANAYDFTRADRVKDYAVKNHIRLHGHNLIWQLSARDIPWLLNLASDSAAFADSVKNYIHTVVSHYKGIAASWDVVNEPIRSDGQLRDASDVSCSGGDCYGSIFYKVLGRNYMDLVFTWAHEADSSALLFINDYALETNDVKLQGLIDIASDMRSRGIPVHGLGTQMHMNVFTPEEGIENMFRKLGESGFLVHVSELDISVNPSNDPDYYFDAAEQEKQAEKYRFVAEAYQRFVPPDKRFGITLWGFTDYDSWLRGNGGNNNDWPCLYDLDLSPKPAWYGLYQGLNFQASTLLPGRIQAENYIYSRNEPQIDTTDFDKSGCIKNLTVGDSLVYQVNVKRPGAYIFHYRVANPGVDTALLVLKEGSQIMDSVIVPPTGDSWISVGGEDVIALNSGFHDMTLSVIKDTMQINWFEGFTETVELPGKMEGEAWTESAGVSVASASDKDGSPAAAFSTEGSYTQYTVYSTSSDTLFLNLRVYKSASATGKLFLKMGDQVLDSLEVLSPAGVWSTVRAKVSLPKGLITLRLESGSPVQMQVNWLSFVPQIDLPGKIEAEDFYQDQGFTEAPSGDVDGTLAMSITGFGELKCPVRVMRSNRYFIAFRVKGAGTLETWLDGALLEHIDLSGSGDTINWQTIYSAQDLVEGIHELKLKINGRDAAINWVQVSKYAEVPGKLEAENYVSNKGTRIGASNDVDGSSCLNYIGSGDYTEYVVNVRNGGKFTLVLRASRGVTGSVPVYVKSGNTTLANVTIKNTGSWSTYADFSGQISLTSGVQIIRLQFPSGGLNLNWMDISSSQYYVDLMDTLEQVYQLKNGVYTIGGSSENAILQGRTFENFELKATVSDINVDGQMFTRGLLVDESEKAAQAWNESVYVTNSRPVVKGNTYLAVFNLRCASCTPSTKGSVSFDLKNNNSPWNSEITKSFSVASDWKMYFVPAQVKTDYALNSFRMHFVFGSMAQQIELGGLALVDLGTAYTPAQVQANINNPPSEIMSFLEDRVLCYPNPTSGRVHIYNPFKNEKVIAVYSVSGKLIHQQVLKGDEEASISLEGYPNGIYLLKWKQAGIAGEQKIVLIH